MVDANKELQRKIKLDGFDESDSNDEHEKEEDEKEEDAMVEDGNNEDEKEEEAMVEDGKNEDGKNEHEAEKTPTPSKSETGTKRTSSRLRTVAASSKKGCSPPLKCIFNCIFNCRWQERRC